MKNKKSKIIIPAMGLILLSTAASISGSVAWFTASRTAEFKAGTFAVVNTNSNLSYSLDNGIGVNLDGDESIANKTKVYNKTGNTLTDASLDVTEVGASVIIPNDTREKMAARAHVLETENEDPLKISESTPNLRESGEGYKIYSAFAWDVTFNVTFPSETSKDVGLFFDASKSWAHIAYKAKAGDKSDGLYYENSDLTGLVAAETNLTDGTTYYRALPKTAPLDANEDGDYADVGDKVGSTGYGFRMAFIPKTVGKASEGYAKVWSPFRTAANGGVTFIDSDAALTPTLPNMPAGVAYTTNTIKATNTAGNNNTIATATVENGKVLIGNSDAVPGNSTETAAEALAANNNYLGFFKADSEAVGGVSLTFTVVVWYEGTDLSITPDAKEFEQVTTSLSFAVADLNAA